MKHLIYGLRLIGDTEVRYVGLTRQSLAMRLEGHMSTASHMPLPTVYALWLLENAERVQIFPIGEADCLADAKVREREIVSACLAMDHRLFNRWLVPAERRIPNWGAPVTKRAAA